jgi:hypothetical protein
VTSSSSASSSRCSTGEDACTSLLSQHGLLQGSRASSQAAGTACFSTNAERKWRTLVLVLRQLAAQANYQTVLSVLMQTMCLPAHHPTPSRLVHLYLFSAP